jgi:hypothetical protein
MAWAVGKSWHKAKRVREHRAFKKWEALGLVTPAKERPAVAIDEIRRQGRILADRGLGQDGPALPLTKGRAHSNSRRQPKAVPRGRRGGTR